MNVARHITISADPLAHDAGPLTHVRAPGLLFFDLGVDVPRLTELPVRAAYRATVSANQQTMPCVVAVIAASMPVDAGARLAQNLEAKSHRNVHCRLLITS